jgi:hypothetical protein
MDDGRFFGRLGAIDPPRDAANDDAFARLEKEMMAMKNAIGGLSGKIAGAATTSGPRRKTKPSGA